MQRLQQTGQASFPIKPLHLRSQFRRHHNSIDHRRQKTLQIKSAPPCNEHRLPPRRDLRHRLPRKRIIRHDIKRGIHRLQVDEVVRNPRLLRRTRFCGPDIHPTINQRGITGNNLGMVRLRIAQRIFGLTHRSGSTNYMHCMGHFDLSIPAEFEI